MARFDAGRQISQMSLHSMNKYENEKVRERLVVWNRGFMQNKKKLFNYNFFSIFNFLFYVTL